MELIHLLAGHGFSTFSAVAIVASLLFTAVHVRHLERAQRVSNLLTLTRDHRDIWSEMLRNPELGRILDAEADLTRKPVTLAESLFVTFVIQHLQAVFKASKEEMMALPESTSRDVAAFFSLPIPKSIWDATQSYQDKELIAFVDQLLAKASEVRCL